MPSGGIGECSRHQDLVLTGRRAPVILSLSGRPTETVEILGNEKTPAQSVGLADHRGYERTILFATTHTAPV